MENNSFSGKNGEYGRLSNPITGFMGAVIGALIGYFLTVLGGVSFVCRMMKTVQ